MSSSNMVSLNFPQPDIAVIRIDAPDSSANVLDDQLFEELSSTIDSLSKRELKGAILTSSKPTIFVAGADLKQIQKTADYSDGEILQFCRQGRAVMKKFSSNKFPVVAAIHGAAVGGGLELALWCDYRIATDDRSTRLGLPEVKLGLVPSWSGTVLLPRLTSFSDAVELITSGKLISAKESLGIGLIDGVVHCDEPADAAANLQAEAIKLIENAHQKDWLARREQLQQPVENCGDLEAVVNSAAKDIIASKDVYLYAPTVALEHLARTATLDAESAEASESMTMAQVYGSPANRGLLHHYFLVRHNRKNPGLVDCSLDSKPVHKVGIVGAGLMGSSIAARCAGAGVEVRLLDANPGAATLAATRINQPLPEPQVTAIDDYDQLTGVDLVIESVVETINVKKSVLQKVESVAGVPDWIATNTSAIQIGAISESMSQRETFCGIHFCHPELMSLVEVICGPDTAEQTIADSVAFVRQLRMIPVAINDCPGFVVNRLLAAMINESLQLYSEGYSIAFIDEAMREFGFNSGPFEIIDIIGADTCMYAGRSMWQDGLQCVSLSPILPRLVKKNLLGRKAGTGFYRYESADGKAIFDDAIDTELKDYRTGDGPANLDADALVLRILSSVALEASLILEEEVVADGRDIDLCIIHGLSFPTHRGGILFWADQVGAGVLNQILSDRSSATLKKMERDGTTFF